jgi:hypothetical protein
LPIFAEFDGDIIIVQHVMVEIFLDRFTLIAEAKDELVESIMGVMFHDVPEDGFRPDFDHGFWPKFSFLAQASSHASTENDNFHQKPF